MISARSNSDIGTRSFHEVDTGVQPDQGRERKSLELELQNQITRLNDQARIFIPLIALCLIVAIPIWSKSLTRFVILLLSPFVLFPLAFCVVHLTLAWRGISRTRARIRDWDLNHNGPESGSSGHLN